jgi:hypothetical protein
MYVCMCVYVCYSVHVCVWYLDRSSCAFALPSSDDDVAAHRRFSKADVSWSKGSKKEVVLEVENISFYLFLNT